MNSNVNQILAEVHKVIVGKDDVMEKILMTLISRGHVLLDDVPGTGKTTAALAFHRALGLRYRRMQFTPDVMPADVTGFSVYNKATGALDYSRAPPCATFFWPTRSTAPQARPSRPFWRLWRRGASRSTASRGRPPEALHRHRHAEPHRFGRHANAARIPARPLHGAALHGVSRF